MIEPNRGFRWSIMNEEVIPK